MTVYEVKCKLYDKELLKSVFNLKCMCASCQRPTCEGCETYKKNYSTEVDKLYRSKCFQCLNINMGR